MTEKSSGDIEDGIYGEVVDDETEVHNEREEYSAVVDAFNAASKKACFFSSAFVIASMDSIDLVRSQPE